MTKLPRLALRALPMLALAACIETAPSPAADDDDLCGAAALAGLVGQPAEVARTMQLPAGTRIINPGDPVTRDLRRDRLNIEIGADGNIARVACY
ncbi:Peptidase inhibitor I78 family protein [Paracoccus solventivorans]|uniref:Peptidase inhibitor I78 family protein n=1 Tax=Paracoccus solventivorans TaxID=53463 RepID=A0A1M7IGL9_9RHOB|nr:I78 family peptidase inhibitor [Paracoccus solventivorans]SHM39723.1 Peptidase inhibitor I78 family protein [Paracoccus solventivorans]